MRFLFINGQAEHFTLHEVQRLFRHPASITTLLLASALIIWLRPYEGLSALSASQLVIYWGMVLPGTFTAYLVMLLAMGRWLRTSYSIFAHLAAASACAVLSPLMRRVLGMVPANWAEVLEAFAFTLVASAAIELFMVTYLSNRIRPAQPPSPPPGMAGASAEAAPAPSPAQPPDGGGAPAVAMLALLGRRYDPHELRLISAEEHYVRIHTKTRQDLLRGRISDIEAQLPADLGLRVHRSHWVAACAVRQLHRRREGWVLGTCLGIEVPVARARREAVRDWLQDSGVAGSEPDR